MLKIFKTVAFAEGISLLVLLFLAMPLKYCFAMPVFVKVFGMMHGILFITYIILAILLSQKDNWSFKKFFVISLAAIVPFGTFYVEKKYLNYA